MAAYAESIRVSFARTRTSRYLDGVIPAIALMISIQYELLLPKYNGAYPIAIQDTNFSKIGCAKKKCIMILYKSERRKQVLVGKSRVWSLHGPIFIWTKGKILN